MQAIGFDTRKQANIIDTDIRYPYPTDMDADFHPRESLDIARALHGTESIARSESARHIAATVKASYGPLLQDFRSIASRFDAATFIAAPSSSIAPANIADQWVGVTVPTNDISNVPVSIRLPATTAVLCL